MSPAHSVRLAIAPDVRTEVAQVLRLLANQPWLIAGRDDEAITRVRRNQGDLRRALQRLGWTLVVERDFVRLVKSPPPRLSAWASSAPKPLACAWMFLLAAAAEGLPQQVTIGQLVATGKAAAAEAGVPLTGEMSERRAIVAAASELVDRGVLEATQGQVDAYLDDDDARVLLTIFHNRLQRLVAHYDPSSDPSEDPGRWLANVTRESDAGRRMRRRLVDDTCVHTLDLDVDEADWLSRRLRGDDGAPLAEAFGLSIERRTEGAAFVVPTDAFRYPRELGQVPYPSSGIVPHVALLLSDAVAASGAKAGSPGPGGPGPGWIGMPRTQVLRELVEIASRQHAGSGGWPADRLDNVPGLLADVEALLVGVGLLRLIHDWWWLSPVTGRWEPPPNSAFNPPSRPMPAVPTALGLFDEEDP